MYTLFTLEDVYGIKIGTLDGEACLRLDKHEKTTYLSLFDMFTAWQQMADKLQCEEIAKEEYDAWRYNFTSGNTVELK